MVGEMVPARLREDLVLKHLADVLQGKDDAHHKMSEDEARLMGYAASLVQGTVQDEANRLKAFIASCRALVPSFNESQKFHPEARDKIQAKWGSPWHLDCQKLRRELPLYTIQSF